NVSGKRKGPGAPGPSSRIATALEAHERRETVRAWDLEGSAGGGRAENGARLAAGARRRGGRVVAPGRGVDRPGLLRVGNVEDLALDTELDRPPDGERRFEGGVELIDRRRGLGAAGLVVEGLGRAAQAGARRRGRRHRAARDQDVHRPLFLIVDA